MQRLMTDPRITMHLLPLPVRSGPAGSSKAQQEEIGAPPVQKVKKAKASNKAKSMCPEELKEYKQFDDKNQTICWAFNLAKGCREKVTNGRCRKGAHICIKCHRANHSLVACRAKA